MIDKREKLVEVANNNFVTKDPEKCDSHWS